MNQWEIDGKTRLYGLLGNPVSHSLSPFIHNEGFRRLSLNARYLAFSVKEEDLESTLSALRKMGVGGLNLTMPLKEAVLPLCDSLSKEARLSSSVNTLVFSENGKMTGCSTDGIGFFRALESENGAVNGKKLCLMGLGGAGKAILSRAVYTEISEIRLLQRASSIEKNRVFIEKVEQETGKRILLGSYEENFWRKAISLSILQMWEWGRRLLSFRIENSFIRGCLLPTAFIIPLKRSCFRRQRKKDKAT